MKMWGTVEGRARLEIEPALLSDEVRPSRYRGSDWWTDCGDEEALDKLATARRLYDAREMTVAQIAAVVGVGRSTLYRALVKDAPTSSTTSPDAASSARRAG